MGFWMTDDFNEPIDELFDVLKDDKAPRRTRKR